MNRQINRCYPLLFSALLLFLAACGQDAQPTAAAPSAPGFSFSVDPTAGSVAVETPGPKLTVTAPAECVDGSRTLTPGDELKLADYDFAFLPGNLLEITASFTNTTLNTYEQPFTFVATDATNNVFSTTEPVVTDAGLGEDGKLSPKETTAVLTFMVEHKGQAFSYGVAAEAEVSCADEQVDPPVDPTPDDAVLTLSKSDGVKTVEPGDTITYTLNYANTSDFDSSPATLTETVPENTVFSKEASGNAEWLCADASEPGVICALNLGAIPANTSGSVTFAVRVDKPLAEGVSEISNTATIQDNQPSDENPEPKVDDTATETTPVVIPPEPNAALSLKKSDGDVTAMPGDTIKYVLSYENTSDFASKPAVITETVPAFTSFDAAGSDAGWSCNGTTCTLDVGIIQANGTGTATFVVTVDKPLDAEVNEISNTATIQDQAGPEVDSTAVEATPVVREDTCDTVVSIPDANLEQAIRNTLGKNSGELTCGDMASLSYLSNDFWGPSSTSGISDLTGLEYATNLQYLEIYNFNDSRLSDLTPLSGLTNLQTLYLYNNQISDISALSNLTNLQTLYLDSNRISDISPLVSNPGIGDGNDSIVLYNNCLVSPEAQTDINTLEARNPSQQNIYADPQGNAQCGI